MKTSLILFLLVLVVGISFLFFRKKRNMSLECTVPLTISEKTSHILVPVTIQDSTYLFLWDTGAEISLILKDKIDDVPLEILPRRSTDTIKVAREVRIESSAIAELVDFRVGCFNIDGQIRVKNHKELDKLDAQITGIIGQDIISQFCWKLDWRKNVFTISDLDTNLDTKDVSSDGLSKLVIPFNYFPATSKAPYFNFTFAGKNYSFLFDSGFSFVMNNDGETIRSVMIFNKKDNDLGDKSRRKITFSRDLYPDEEQKVILLDYLDIQGHTFNNVYINLESLRENLNICTVHFLELFDEIYYDPLNKVVTFYYKDGIKDSI